MATESTAVNCKSRSENNLLQVGIPYGKFWFSQSVSDLIFFLLRIESLQNEICQFW